MKPTITNAAQLLDMKRQSLQNHKLRGSLPVKQAYPFAFSVNVSPDWLLYGEGPKEAPQYTAKGNAIIDAIVKELNNPHRLLPMNDTARVMGINPDNPSQHLDLPEEFADAINLVNQIFQEGDQNKIAAIMAQLKAFKPEAE
ncbi:MAG: helix-turn-helix domain containing protein [Deltaproteobacteria bacterium]|nr:helix-turn-helix domain containing protein [Deltaproteobacteria bacterium]